jgi:hypothetical protein
MAKICAFTDAKPRGLKPSEKTYQIYSGDGLYLQSGLVA